MDARLGMAAVTFDPLSDLVQDQDCDTLLLHLPGFTKEQVRVQLTSSRVLKISGSRPIGDGKMSSFQKDFPIPGNIDSNKITARFENGVLYVKQPKVIAPLAAQKDEQKTAALVPAAPKTAEEHQQTAPNAADSKKEEKTEGGKKGAGARSEGEKTSGSNVGMLKMKMMRVLLLLFAFALGMYVSKLRWVSTELMDA